MYATATVLWAAVAHLRSGWFASDLDRDTVTLMMLLNTAVARQIDSQLKRQGLKPLALGIALNEGDRKASAPIRGHDVWTTAQFEVAAEMLGIGLDDLLLRCVRRLGEPL